MNLFFSGIAAFEMEHTHWLEEQTKRVSEIRTALQAHVSDIELKMLVDICLSHYANLFRMKADAAKADVFFLISGMWRTSTERFFQWIGGFRPSELLNVRPSLFFNLYMLAVFTRKNTILNALNCCFQVVMPYIEPLTDQQILEVRNLQQSSQQAEEALSQGLDKLQQSLVESISTQIKVVDSVNFGAQMGSAMENLQALEGFANQVMLLQSQMVLNPLSFIFIELLAKSKKVCVFLFCLHKSIETLSCLSMEQADHLRQQSLQQMSKILTTRQAARGLLALGEYFHRLRALSSLWAARPREHT